MIVRGPRLASNILVSSVMAAIGEDESSRLVRQSSVCCFQKALFGEGS